MFGLEVKLERAARKLAAFSIAGVLAAVGISFLTVAAWIALAELRSDSFAALIIGGIYLGAALIVLAIGLARPRRVVPAAYPAASPMAGLSPLQTVVLSFLQGLEQGRQSVRVRR